MGAIRPQRLPATDRLVLRRLGEADLAFVVALLNDPAWIAHIGDRGVRDRAAARGWIAGGPDAGFRAHGFGLMALDLRGGGPTIGICGLIRRPGLDDADLGYALLPGYRGHGYATEAARAVLAWARDAHGLRRVVAIVAPANVASAHVLARCGFAFERALRMPGDAGTVHLHAVRLDA